MRQTRQIDVGLIEASLGGKHPKTGDRICPAVQEFGKRLACDCIGRYSHHIGVEKVHHLCTACLRTQAGIDGQLHQAGVAVVQVVQVMKANATTASDTITAVTLTNYGNSTVASNVLNTVTLKGATVASGTLGLNTTATDTSVRATTLNLNLAGGSIGAVTGTQADLYTTVNVATSAATTVADQSFAAATALNFSGSGVATFTANTGIGAVVAITSTGGGVSLGTALGTGVAFTGGDGVETISIASTTKAISLGAGNDKVTTSTAAVGTGGSVAAGDGTDTIVMTDTLAAGADGSSTFNSKFTGFEVLEISDAFVEDALDVEGLNSVSQVTLALGVSGTAAINNLASGGTVKVKANGASTPDLTVAVRSALVGTADVLNLNLSKQGILTTGSVTAANVETINIAAADATTTATSGVYGAAAIHTLTLVAAAAKSIVVTGNNGLNLTNTTNVAVTSFDASGVVGNDASTTDTLANLAVTFASAYTGTGTTVTITGGAGSDSLTGNTKIDIISGGAGADTITGGGGADVLTGGAGIDTFAFGTSGSLYSTAVVKIADFVATTTTSNAGDILTFGGNTTVLAADTTTLVAGSNVNTNAAGLVSFHANDTTYALKVAAIQADTQLDAIGSVAMFVDSGNTYVYYAGAATGNTDDQIIELTGVTTLTTMTGGAGAAATVTIA